MVDDASTKAHQGSSKRADAAGHAGHPAGTGSADPESRVCATLRLAGAP